ncbi:MAG: hypothetical protein VB070_01360 [Clostridiaceae bacterium]|nr:hypothetical protein [Clostridiaceae bacterium]
MLCTNIRCYKNHAEKPGRLPLCSDFIFTLILLICFLTAGCQKTGSLIAGTAEPAGTSAAVKEFNKNVMTERTDVIISYRRATAKLSHTGDRSGEKAYSPAAEPFGLQVGIVGSIGYFAGQTNDLGQKMPADPHRFLAREKLRIYLDFTSPPQMIRMRFASQEYNLAGVEGQTHYETYLHIPELPSTLSWTDKRLAPPMTLQVTAVDKNNPPNQIDAVIDDIELTGSVYDIVHAQIADPA